jgi:hypothetical protein
MSGRPARVTVGATEVDAIQLDARGDARASPRWGVLSRVLPGRRSVRLSGKETEYSRLCGRAPCVLLPATGPIVHFFCRYALQSSSVLSAEASLPARLSRGDLELESWLARSFPAADDLPRIRSRMTFGELRSRRQRKAVVSHHPYARAGY